MEDICPLCQGKVVDGRCTECGYDVPDEEELELIGSIYNGEPIMSEENAVGYADPSYVPIIQVASDAEEDKDKEEIQKEQDNKYDLPYDTQQQNKPKSALMSILRSVFYWIIVAVTPFAELVLFLNSLIGLKFRLAYIFAGIFVLKIIVFIWYLSYLKSFF